MIRTKEVEENEAMAERDLSRMWRGWIIGMSFKAGMKNVRYGQNSCAEII
jgi:hypothetical protein